MKKILLFMMCMVFILPSVLGVHTLDEDLVLYYSFDVDDVVVSQVIDVANDHDGSCENMASNCNTEPGKIKNATRFDGANDFIQNDTVAGSNASTYAFWMNGDTYTNGDFVFIHDNGATRVAYVQYSVDHFNCNFRDTVGAWRTAEFTSATGEWHHIICMHNASGVYAIVDGSVVDSYSGAFSVATGDTQLHIGIHNGEVTGPYDGVLDEFGYWNRSLTPTEIGELYADGDGFAYPFEYEAFDSYTLTMMTCDASTTPSVLLLLGFTLILTLLWMFSFVVRIPLFSMVLGAVFMFFSWYVGACFVLALYLFFIMGLMNIFHALMVVSSSTDHI